MPHSPRHPPGSPGGRSTPGWHERCTCAGAASGDGHATQLEAPHRCPHSPPLPGASGTPAQQAQHQKAQHALVQQAQHEYVDQLVRTRSSRARGGAARPTGMAAGEPSWSQHQSVLDLSMDVHLGGDGGAGSMAADGGARGGGGTIWLTQEDMMALATYHTSATVMFCE